MTQALLDFATRFGYLAVLLGVGVESMGVPVPGETTLLVGAVLAGHGHLVPVFVGVAGWMGAVLGDNLGYVIGRRWGRRLVTVPLVSRLYRPEHLLVADRFFARHGWLAVFFGRFVAILRIFAGPLAGMHHMPWRRFVVANAAGAACWVTVIVLIGLLIGANLDHAVSLVARLGYAGLVIVVLLAAGLVVWHVAVRRRRRS